MHVNETESLKRCPFCGGKALLCEKDSPYSSKYRYQVICLECHASGEDFWSNSPEKAARKAMEAWNRRECDDKRAQAEQEREVFCNSLAEDEAAPMMEAVKLYAYSTCYELRFCENMARLYGCVPLDSDGDNLLTFLCTLYHYGQVQGIRAERARRKRGQQA